MCYVERRSLRQCSTGAAGTGGLAGPAAGLCFPFTFLKAFTHLLLIFPVTFSLELGDDTVKLRVQQYYNTLKPKSTWLLLKGRL